MLESIDGSERLAYKIQVAADNGNGCGAPGRQVTFRVGGQQLPDGHAWGNSQACYYPLGEEEGFVPPCFTAFQLYLPMIRGGSGGGVNGR